MTVSECDWILPTDTKAFAFPQTAAAVGIEKRERLTAPQGSVDVVTVTFPDGLQIIDFDGNLSAPLTTPIQDGTEYLSFAFVRNGTIVTRAANLDFEFRAEPGVGRIVYHGDFVGTATFSNAGPIKILSICVPKSYLDTVLEDPLPGLNVVSGRFAQAPIAVSPAIRQCVDTMAECPFDGPVRHLFIRAKAYEIMTIAATMADHRNLETLTPHDVAHVHAARDILERGLDAPPTVPELARMVGTNECRLKRDFKLVLHTTPYAYVVARRMEIARVALMRGARSITTIAQQVGYSNTSHFSAAFFKHHGMLPRDVKKAAKQNPY